MLKARNVTLISIFAAVSFSAFAGNESSGGGAAAVCRDSAGRIQSAQLLDLYEGEVRFGLNIPRSNDSPDFQLGQMLSRLNHYPVLRGRFALAIRDAIQRIEFLPPGVGLSPGVDLGRDHGVVIPEGCRIEYVGYYETTGKLKIARGVFSALSPTDQAALMVHEAVYQLARDRGHRDSAKSRILTATLFAAGVSDENLLEAARSISPANQTRDLDLFNAHYPVPAPLSQEPVRIRAVVTPVEHRNVGFRLGYSRPDSGLWKRTENEGTGGEMAIELTDPQHAVQGDAFTLMETKGRRSAAFTFRLYLNDVQVASGAVPVGANTVLFFVYETPALPPIPMP